MLLALRNNVSPWIVTPPDSEGWTPVTTDAETWVPVSADSETWTRAPLSGQS